MVWVDVFRRARPVTVLKTCFCIVLRWLDSLINEYANDKDQDNKRTARSYDSLAGCNVPRGLMFLTGSRLALLKPGGGPELGPLRATGDSGLGAPPPLLGPPFRFPIGMLLVPEIPEGGRRESLCRTRGSKRPC